MTRLLTTILAAAVCMTAATARTAADFFVDAPQAAVPYLDKNARLDMLDYYRSKLPPKTTNTLNNQVRIDAEDESLLIFTAGDSVSMQIGVLTQGRDTLLMVIETIPISVPDSRVTLFDTRWQPYAKTTVVAPTLGDWLTAEGATHRAEVEEWLPFMTAVANFEPATQTLVFTRTIDGYFSDSDEESQRLLNYLKPQLTYTLRGGLLSPVKAGKRAEPSL